MQIKAVTQTMVRENKELRLARSRPAGSSKPTAEVTCELVFAGRC